MNNIIEDYYFESVKGLTENVLQVQSDWYKHIFNLSPKQQIVYTIIVFHNQVQNGGLHQYFFNSYSQFCFLTINNLKKIGALERASILESALSEVNKDKFDENYFKELIFNRKISRITEFEQYLTNFLDDLDTKYYEIENEDIEKLLTHFLKNN